ncbi:hypothetical protein DEO72_LG9g1252 [Vigna unguiculata]|uniref:Uncharacterized protein n=1 Tax=Vigna unguiculata TaxID=3917 RepID=A0A4D6N069_VIGUN|nr:hypothetical protein DEO72_LG9g1252 [Vigna unguiculata]
MTAVGDVDEVKVWNVRELPRGQDISKSACFWGRYSADVDQIKSRVLENEQGDGEDLQDLKRTRGIISFHRILAFRAKVTTSRSLSQRKMTVMTL